MAKVALPALLGRTSGEGHVPHTTGKVVGFSVAAMQLKHARDEARDATMTPDPRPDTGTPWMPTDWLHTGDA